MKNCPQCNASYEDSMFFCLEDGTPLKSNDSAVQSNPATFENTLVMPTDEKTLNLPPQTDLTGEKTLTLTTEAVTEQKSVQTEVWQPQTLPPQVLPVAETNETIPLSGYRDNDERSSRGKFIIVGGLFGLIALLSTAFGGWWFLQRNSDEVAIANTNKQLNNSNNNLGFSNTNISNAFGETNSVGSNIVSSNNLEVNTITNKPTPKPSPSATKDKKESPTPTSAPTPESTSTPQPTPNPKTPTPTPTPTPLPTRPVPKIVSGGVLNGRATNLVRPSYPPAAKAVRASGAVSVQVLVDEDGNVVRAGAVSGHALLRSAAEQAARASKFSPTILAGQPVKVTGVIVYNFSAQ